MFITLIPVHFILIRSDTLHGILLNIPPNANIRFHLVRVINCSVTVNVVKTVIHFKLLHSLLHTVKPFYIGILSSQPGK